MNNPLQASRAIPASAIQFSEPLSFANQQTIIHTAIFDLRKLLPDPHIERWAAQNMLRPRIMEGAAGKPVWVPASAPWHLTATRAMEARQLKRFTPKQLKGFSRHMVDSLTAAINGKLEELMVCPPRPLWQQIFRRVAFTAIRIRYLARLVAWRIGQ